MPSYCKAAASRIAMSKAVAGADGQRLVTQPDVVAGRAVSKGAAGGYLNSPLRNSTVSKKASASH